MNSKSYEIGYKNGSSGRGTNGYNPGKRIFGGKAFLDYDEGFSHGLRDRHEATKFERIALAKLNEVKKIKKH